LRNPTRVAVILVCYRHADENGEFEVSNKRIAKAVCLSERQAKRVLNDLERIGVLKLLKEHQGPIPRRYRITGKPANHDMGDTINAKRPEKLLVTSMSVIGDTEGRTW
jgi:predicted ArsR family transcriptional regulator